jgi:hypothetical protein
MLRRAISLALTCTLATPAVAAPSPAFTVTPRQGLPLDREVQLTLELREAGRSLISRPVATARLAGLNPATLAGAEPAPVHFVLRAAAGTLACRGTGARARATGACSFAPDVAFADALAQRGIGRPTGDQAYHLAVEDVSLVLVDELARQRYAKPTVEQLVACGVHGVTVDQVRMLAQAGHRLGTVGQLITFRIHGVTPEWIAKLTAVDRALMGLPADRLVAMRIHGVTPEWIRALAALGYPALTAEQLIAMRIHGVTPDFVRRAQAGGTRPAPETLVAMRILGPAAGRGL